MIYSAISKIKNRLLIAGTLAVTFLIFTGISCQTDAERFEENASLQPQSQLPLIYHMSFMNRFAAKLYFAGAEENWPLADIYAHEVEEIAELIMEGEYDHDDINISQLLEVMLLPAIEHVEEAIDAQDAAAFQQQYQSLIQTCNQCHTAADYNEIKVTAPESNPFNQDFTPVTSD